MSRLRLVLVLFLSVALDLSVPMPSPASELVEEIQEARPASRGGRSVRYVREVSAPAVMRQAAATTLRPPAARPTKPARTVVSDARVQKIPPLAGAASAPEDH
jgi:hypothetical protein